MAVVFKEAYYTPPFSESEIRINNISNIQDSRGTELNTARSQITFPSNRLRDVEAGESNFQEEGLFELYVDYEPITRDPSQLLMAGEIREIGHAVSEGNRLTTLQIADRSVLLLGGLWSQSFEGRTVPQIIIEVVNNISDLKDEPIDTSEVSLLNKDGGAFPTIDFAFTGKPGIEWLTELSQPAYTGDDRAYIFWIDTNNVLHWKYPSQTSDGTITQGQLDLFSADFNRNADNVINLVIYNAGADLKGNGVLWYYFDATSRTNEVKGRFFPMIELSQKEIFDKEIAEGNLVQSSSGTIPYKGLLYEVTYPITTSWGVAVADFDEYNDAVRDRLKQQGNIRAARITTRFGKLLWKGKVEVKGTRIYNPGDLLTCTFPDFGIFNYLLRVTDISHGIGDDGWVTTINLEEDEEAVSASI